MPSLTWFYSGADPFLSGELRLLGLPALMVEEGGWRSRFLPAHVARDDPADLAVVSIGALAAIARTGGWPTPPTIVLNLDDAAITRDAQQLEAAMLAAGRINAVVARGPVADRWARDNLAGRVPCTTIPDIAERSAEVRAAAMRFGIAGETLPPDEPAPDAFWFAGPGDPVDEDEIAFVLDVAARFAADGRALGLVAPRQTLDWLAQAGPPVTARARAWSPGAVDRLLGLGVRPVLPDAPNAHRRRAKLARYGMRLGTSFDVGPFEPWAVALRWRALIAGLLAPRARVTAAWTLMLFVDLIQDVELALPIIDALRRRPDIRLRLVATSWLLDHNVRLLPELAQRGVVPEVHDRKVVGGEAVSLAGVDALLSIVETTLNVHKRAHALTIRAQARGIPAFTMQHGLENVGLTYFDEVHDTSVDIRSDYIFAWFPSEDVPSSVPLRVRPRLIHVGRPRGAPAPPPPLPQHPGTRFIAVFENLHWGRYSRRFREQFLADCFRLASVLDDAVMVIKPHPAGKWFTRIRDTIDQWPVNVLVADPEDPLWADTTAASLIEAADAVITTPSSVAVDAVLAGKRVAVAGYDLDVASYAPLPILRAYEDWLGFAIARDTGARAAQARARFLGRIDMAGPSEERIVDAIAAVMANRLIRVPRSDTSSPAAGGASS